MEKELRRKLRDEVYGHYARIGKALSSPRRLEILDHLSQAPRKVEAIARMTGQSLANTSQHLQVLRSARLVETKKEGLYVTYSLADEGVSSLMVSLRALGERRLAEVVLANRAAQHERAHAEVDRVALLARVASGDVTIIDVRSYTEYETGHLPGAVSMPLEELSSRIDELLGANEVVAYCRGSYCMLAAEATELLSGAGIRASHLTEGVPEWRAAGFHLGEEG